MATAPNFAYSKSISATNYNLPLLNLLTPEIQIILNNAENHLSEFYDDAHNTNILLDSINIFHQLAKVLDQISLSGVSELSDLIAEAMQYLHKNIYNKNELIIFTISEAVVMLGRYIEFVMLTKSLEPNLLIPIINRLRQAIGKPNVDASVLFKPDFINISIANPISHYESPKSLKLDTFKLIKAYRVGLYIAISNKNGVLKTGDKKKLDAMFNSCAQVAKHSETLFWQAAKTATKNLENALPLSATQKRILIYLEQQFSAYTITKENCFAELMCFACQRNNNLVATLRQSYLEKRTTPQQFKKMRSSLFGPTQAIMTQLNDLIQTEIDDIKSLADDFVQAQSQQLNKEITSDIFEKLKNLGSVMQVVNLPHASISLTKAANNVIKWSTPASADFDELLSSLIVSENAAIYLSKAHTPGAIVQPLLNNKTSVHMLDTAFFTLVKESIKVIDIIESAFKDFIENGMIEVDYISETPYLIKQISGAAKFLGLYNGSNILMSLSEYIDDNLLNHSSGSSSQPLTSEINLNLINEQILANIGNIVLVSDYYLKAFENKQPLNTNAMYIANNSLNNLLAS